MLHGLFFSIFAASLLFSLPAAAGPAEDYQEARLLYLTAAASIAAYPDGAVNIVMAAMGREGWRIVPYIQKDETAQAKFFFARKEAPLLPEEYLLAISGTTTKKDFALDLKVGKVYFAGRTFDEFKEYAEIKPDSPNLVPMVHKGFNQYVQTAFDAETETTAGEKPGQKIAELLLSQPESIIYLTGHSSGGSAAILLGARLISLGVRPEQIRIVTFGAPAVGNAVFAEKYSPDLNLIRVVVTGDPIPGLLKIFSSGYRQFGREIHFNTEGYTFDEKHFTNLYLDCAIKNYYDKRLAAVQAGVPAVVLPAEKPPVDGKRLYIAEINNNLPKEMNAEFNYMHEVLLDQYRYTVPAYVIREDDTNNPLHFEALREKAAAAGCDRMVIVNIWGRRLDDPAGYTGGLLSDVGTMHDVNVIEQAVFRVSDGELIDGRTYEKGSKYFTSLVALTSAAVTLSSEYAIWSGQ